MWFLPTFQPTKKVWPFNSRDLTLFNCIFLKLSFCNFGCFKRGKPLCEWLSIEWTTHTGTYPWNILRLSRSLLKQSFTCRHLEIWIHNTDCHTHIARGHFPPVQTSKKRILCISFCHAVLSSSQLFVILLPGVFVISFCISNWQLLTIETMGFCPRPWRRLMRVSAVGMEALLEQ